MAKANIELTMTSLPSLLLLPGHIQSKKGHFSVSGIFRGGRYYFFTRENVPLSLNRS